MCTSSTQVPEVHPLWHHKGYRCLSKVRNFTKKKCWQISLAPPRFCRRIKTRVLTGGYRWGANRFPDDWGSRRGFWIYSGFKQKQQQPTTVTHWDLWMFEKHKCIDGRLPRVLNSRCCSEKVLHFTLTTCNHHSTTRGACGKFIWVWALAIGYRKYIFSLENMKTYGWC